MENFDNILLAITINIKKNGPNIFSKIYGIPLLW